jgi:hypothetical protein
MTLTNTPASSACVALTAFRFHRVSCITVDVSGSFFARDINDRPCNRVGVARHACHHTCVHAYHRSRVRRPECRGSRNVPRYRGDATQVSVGMFVRTVPFPKSGVMRNDGSIRRQSSAFGMRVSNQRVCVCSRVTSGHMRFSGITAQRARRRHVRANQAGGRIRVDRARRNICAFNTYNDTFPPKLDTSKRLYELCGSAQCPHVHTHVRTSVRPHV